MTTPRAMALLVLVVAAPGCATESGTRLGYKSGSHLLFSVRATWQEFVGWPPVGTTDDAATAAREGGWWGDEVPVMPAR
jgi:hypothetical protein